MKIIQDSLTACTAHLQHVALERESVKNEFTGCHAKSLVFLLKSIQTETENKTHKEINEISSVAVPLLMTLCNLQRKLLL